MLNWFDGAKIGKIIERTKKKANFLFQEQHLREDKGAAPDGHSDKSHQMIAYILASLR